jgi:Ca2+:H+ antiporter
VSALSPRQRIILVVIFLATAAAGAMHYGGVNPTATFLVSTVALAGLAWIVSFSTEAVGARLGPAITGILQTTLGNLPELFIVIFALSDGQLVVARNSIIGSIFANALLVLGLVLAIGAIRSPDGIMRFHPRLPNDTATLLILSNFLIVIVGLAVASSDKASHHLTEISSIGAVLMLIVYSAWAFSYLRTPHDGAAAPDETPGGEPAAHEPVPMGLALGLLGVGGVGAAFVSDWFVSALTPAVGQLHISKAFAGLVIVAIAGNAVENTTGLVLAWKGEADLAISIVKNSVSQIAAFLFPALVLVSLAFSTHLTFSLAPVYIGALFLTGIAVWQITGDGEATLFEGLALIALYVMLATFTAFE